jgi:putative DNA primase/helicase
VKTYRPFHQDDNGRWLMADPPGELPLFHLPKLIVPDLNPESEPVFIVEGEKCVCTLEETLGVLVTTSAHGSNGARKTDWEPLAGRDVVILPDNDKTGEQDYAATVASLLMQLSPQASVKIVELPGLPEKGDIVDWLEARNGKPTEEIKRELLELVNNAEVIREAAQTTKTKPKKKKPKRKVPPASW